MFCIIILFHEKKGHTFTIMIDLDKDRLVEIPPSGWPPDRLKKISARTSNAMITRKNATT